MDDFAFYVDSDTTGFISSNREGGKGSDDIWSFNLPPLNYNIKGMAMSKGDDRTGAGRGESVELVKEYAFKTLLLNQLYCNIGATNTSSQLLFKKCEFTEVGIKKQWNKISSTEFEDEILFQCIK